MAKNVGNKGLCIKAGKLAGNIVRQAYPIRKLGTSAYQGAQKIVKKGETVFKSTFSLCVGHGPGKKLKNYQQKQQRFFTRLGDLIFHLRKNGVKNIFIQPDVKEMLDEAARLEEHIQAVRQEITAQRLAKQTEISFNHAVADLKNKDPQIRLTAIQALETSGKKEAISHLTHLLRDPDETIRHRTASAIKILTELSFAATQKPEREIEDAPVLPDEIRFEPEPQHEPQVIPKEVIQPQAETECEPEAKPDPKPEPEKIDKPTLPTTKKRRPRLKPQRKTPTPPPETAKAEPEVKPEPETQLEEEVKPEPDESAKVIPPVTKKKPRKKPKRKALPSPDKEVKPEAESKPETPVEGEPEPELPTEPEASSTENP